MRITLIISEKILGFFICILSFIKGLFKRLLCFLNIRRRKLSTSGEPMILPIHHSIDQKAKATPPLTSLYSKSSSNGDYNRSIGMSTSDDVNDPGSIELQPWDDWATTSHSDRGFSTTSMTYAPATERYRQEQARKLLLQQQQQQENNQSSAAKPSDELAQSFLNDLTPVLKKPAKIRLKRSLDERDSLEIAKSRLALTTDYVPPVNPELTTWNEESFNSLGNNGVNMGWSDDDDLELEADLTMRQMRRSQRLKREREAAHRLALSSSAASATASKT